MNRKRIVVFGGASPCPGEPTYQEAERLGYLLGQAGFTILNGGYMGTMEAVSKGGSQAGGYVIGVTCMEIENWRGGQANPFLHQELHCKTLAERLEVLIHECDAAIALPGGIGTLAEILYLWNHLIIEAVPAKPLILVGEAWQVIFDTFFNLCDGYTPASQSDTVFFVSDIEAAAQIVLKI